jgi:ribosomal protein S18 acetylase RimI-like enzyme
MNKQDVSIRSACLDDLTMIVGLLADDEIGVLRESTQASFAPSYEQAFVNVQGDPNSELLVATIGEKVVGCLQLTQIAGLSYRGSRRCQIEDVRVLTKFRAVGIGTMLLNEAENRAKLRGCKLLQLLVHSDRVDAQRFYRRCGFESIHLGFRKTIGT